jgi:hypothetical protein
MNIHQLPTFRSGLKFTDAGQTVSAIATTIADPGVDTNLPTEKAVRTLIDGLITLPIGYDSTIMQCVTGTITGATNANPIVIASAGHGRATGQKVMIWGVGGNTNANNANLTVTYVDVDHFSIGVAGNGAYTSGGTWMWLDGFTLLANGQALSTDATVVYMVATDTTVSLLANLPSGSAEASSTKYRLWVGQNNAGTTEYVLSSSESAAPNQIGTASALLHPRLLRGCVRNDTSSNIIQFIMSQTHYEYMSQILCAGSDTTEVFDASLTTTWLDCNCSAFVPAGMRQIEVLQYAGGAIHYVRQKGGSATDGHKVSAVIDQGYTVICDADGFYQVKNSSSTVTKISLRSFVL